MSDKLPDSRKPANFSTTVKLAGLSLDMRTNGPHPGIVAVVDHAHTAYEVQVALTGEYSMVSGDRQLQVMAPDTVCLIPPDCPHRICKTGDNTSLISLRFTYRKRAEQGELAALVQGLEQLPGEPVLLTGMPELCAVMGTFSRELVNPGFSSQLLMDALLQQFFIQLLRSVKQQNSLHQIQGEPGIVPVVREDRYSQIEAFFQENYRKSVTEQDLAKALAVSKRQTSRILRQQCGKSFHEKLEECRMDMALQQLAQTDTPVETVALQTGYGSASGFFVAFKKRFSMTPTEYRRKEQKNSL